MSYYDGMLSWSQKRQIFLIAIPACVFLLALVVLLIGARGKPDCFNNKKDGTERGVDCGGACRLLCDKEASEPLVHFVRAFSVSPGIGSAVAYVENRNQTAGARRAPYAFKLYDENNLLVAERRGDAFIPPWKTFVIFEGQMFVGSRTLSRASFEFTAPFRFEEMPAEPALEIRNKRFVASDAASRLQAELVNPLLISATGITITALLFDGDGTVFAASATEVQYLSARASVPLAFTWSARLQSPARIEISYTVSQF